jgi:hypothetical protein
MEHQLSIFCCGVGEIGNFCRMNKTNAENDAQLKEREAQIRGGYKGVILCTTVDYQKRAISMLKRNGYEIIREFVNPNTNNAVKIWLKDLTKEKPLEEV